jgi:hypothetical protein
MYNFVTLRQAAQNFLVDRETARGVPLPTDLKVQTLRYLEFLHMEGVLVVLGAAPILDLTAAGDCVTLHWPVPGPAVLQLHVTQEGVSECLVRGELAPYVEEDLLVLLRELNKQGQG